MDVGHNIVMADMVLLNGKVISVDSENTIAEAIAIKGNKILGLGKTEEIKKLAQYISHVPGGKGCVRDVIEQVMKVQGKWIEL